MGLKTIARTHSADPDFDGLERRLTAFLAAHNGENNDFYIQFNHVDPSLNVVLVYLDGLPVGCGGFRPVDDSAVEIKRMFVDPENRGQGIGRSVLAELERWSAEKGYRRAVLETSIRLENAVQLYKSSGYEVIPNYGPYIDVADSICFGKELSNSV